MRVFFKVISILVVLLPIHSCFGPFNPDNPQMGIVPNDTTKVKTPPSLVAWWKCDDSTDFINSASYTGIKGELQQGISFDTGVGGTGLSLLFNNDTYVSVLNDSVLNFKNSDFTISLWCKPKKLNDQSILISKGTTDSTSSFVLALYNGAPAIFTGTVAHPIEDTIHYDIWNHIAFVRENGGLSIYLNSKRYSVGAESPCLFNNKTLRIGTTYDSKDYYRGNIDEIKIERKPWSENEIKTEYARFHK
ncbi:MAG TPA: LamG domain-containing protein [Chitinispirillaceae bacterium]|nr:LamG domain-containing protein [Chitinispirillaceae bacterium]